ncbi:hypothetical protein BH23VER1_BH23VER1_06940 [soil metagenome]
MNPRKLIAAIAATAALPMLAVAQTTVTEETTTTTTTKTFTPEVQTKITEYFEVHKDSPYGLPPTIQKKVMVKQLPQAWRSEVIAPGYVITKEQREYLVEPPAELVTVLPPAPKSAKYYVAGGNVIAVETDSMRVVDSVRIPTFNLPEGEYKVDGKKIEVDDDGEIEIEDD